MEKWKKLTMFGMASLTLAACGGGADPDNGADAGPQASQPDAISSSEDSIATSDSATTTPAPSQGGATTDPMAVAITMPEAIDIFREQAPDAQIEEIEFDEDDGIWTYQIQGDTADREWELKIDAQSGDIIESQEDDLDDDNRYIDLDAIMDPTEAVAAARAEAGADAQLDSWKLDVEDDGGQERPEYEIEFEGDNNDFTIHAETGEILERDN